MRSRKPDIVRAGLGSISFITPQTGAAKAWVAANVRTESWQWQGGGFACNPRMADVVMQAAREDFFKTEER